MWSNIKPKWHNQICSTRPKIPPATCITHTLAFRTENNLNRINSRNTRIWRYPLNWLYSFYSTGARVLLQLQCAIYLLYSYLRNEQSQIMEHKYSFSLALSISLWNMYNCGMVNRHFVLVMSSRSWQIKCCFTHFHLLRSFFFPFLRRSRHLQLKNNIRMICCMSKYPFQFSVSVELLFIVNKRELMLWLMMMACST